MTTPSDQLQYRFTHDTLFKMLFVKRPLLLKRLVAAILNTPMEEITDFTITNPEMPPEAMGEKFSKLDIAMLAKQQQVNLEVQVEDEGDYPERSLYYWARAYSSSLIAGKAYITLPRTIGINILDYNMLACKEYHSVYLPLEKTRHDLLTDKMEMIYLELRKLPDEIDKTNDLEVILQLLKARTERDLKEVKDMNVPYIDEAIETYREVIASDEFKEIERIRHRARHDEASILYNLERKLEHKWQAVVDDKDAEIERLRALLEKREE